jgi:hypothetical protein
MLFRAIFYFHLGLLLLLPRDGFSQFSRYWGESFSTKAALLSGAVVGGYSDETSIYYNPSILSDTGLNQLAFANGLASMDYVRYKDAMGKGLDIEKLETSVNSGFISLNLYPKDEFHLVWKASYFNKYDVDGGFEGEYRDRYNVYQITGEEEDYLGRVSSRTEYNDSWFGIGAAKFINKKLSVGVSTFLRYSSLRYDFSKFIEVGGVNQNLLTPKVSVNSSFIDFRGYNWRSTVKIGLNYRFNEKLKGGLVVTTPSIYILGSAGVVHNVSKINIPEHGTGNLLPDYYYDESGEDLRMKVKDPLSVALGLDYQLEKVRWNITTEWFAGLKPYKLIDDTQGSTASSRSEFIPEEEDYLSFVAGGKSIVNVAVGMEIYTARNKSWLFGFKTDFDALKDYDYKELSNLNTLAVAKTNYYHFSSGKSFEFLNFDVLFGLQYSLSRAKGLKAFANFTPPITKDLNDPYSLEGPNNNTMNFAGDALTVFVGLTLKK